MNALGRITGMGMGVELRSQTGRSGQASSRKEVKGEGKQIPGQQSRWAAGTGCAKALGEVVQSWAFGLSQGEHAPEGLREKRGII